MGQKEQNGILQNIWELDQLIKLEPDNAALRGERVKQYLLLWDEYAYFYGYSADTPYEAGYDYEDALTDCNLAIELEPDNFDYHLMRANLCSQMNRYEQAIAEYSYLIERKPADASLYAARGEQYDFWANYAYESWEDFTEEQAKNKQIADYDRAVELEPDNIDYLLRRMNCDESLEAVRALAEINAFIQNEPDNAAIYYKRGILQRTADKYEEAVNDFERASELGLSKYASQHNTSLGYTSLEQWRGVYTALYRNLKAQRISPDRLYSMACFYAKIGFAAETLAYLQRAIVRAPELKARASGQKEFKRLAELDSAFAYEFSLLINE